MKYLILFLKWFSGFLVVAFIGIVIFVHTISFSPDEEVIQRAFSSLEYSPEFTSFEHEGREMHYIAIGDTSKPAILFVHGSPGAWDNFLGFLSNKSLLDNFRLIAVDRPGFGKSGDGIPERSLVKQASDISQVLIKENTSAILVGHSYGGPVIVRMAIDSPELVDGLVIVAGSVDPKLEKTKWYQVPVHYKVLSWILPGMLYSTNEEIIALKSELEDMEPLWNTITQPVSVIQGGKDSLVPKENAGFAKIKLVNAPVTMIEIDKMDHFVPWSNPDLITQELMRILATQTYEEGK